MKKYTIHQAKSQLSKLIQQALRGEEVIISNRNKPLVTLKVLEQPQREKVFGLFKDQILIAEDFDQTPDDFKEYS